MEMASSISMKIYDNWVVDTYLSFTPIFHDITSTVWIIYLIFLCHKDDDKIKSRLSKQPISLLSNDLLSMIISLVFFFLVGGNLMFLGAKVKLIFFHVKTILTIFFG